MKLDNLGKRDVDQKLLVRIALQMQSIVISVTLTNSNPITQSETDRLVDMNIPSDAKVNLERIGEVETGLLMRERSTCLRALTREWPLFWLRHSTPDQSTKSCKSTYTPKPPPNNFPRRTEEQINQRRQKSREQVEKLFSIPKIGI